MNLHSPPSYTCSSRDESRRITTNPAQGTTTVEIHICLCAFFLCVFSGWVMDRRSGPGRVVLKVSMGRAEGGLSYEKLMGRDGPAQPWAGHQRRPTTRPTGRVFVVSLHPRYLLPLGLTRVSINDHKCVRQGSHYQSCSGNGQG